MFIPCPTGVTCLALLTETFRSASRQVPATLRCVEFGVASGFELFVGLDEVLGVAVFTASLLGVTEGEVAGAADGPDPPNSTLPTSDSNAIATSKTMMRRRQYTSGGCGPTG